MLASFKSSQSLANSVQLFCPAFAPDKEGGGDPFPPDGFFRKDPFRISRRGGIRPFHMVVPQLALGKPYRLPVLFRQEKGGAVSKSSPLIPAESSSSEWFPHSLAASFAREA